VPPPPREFPFKGRAWQAGTQKLTDEQVMAARAVVGSVGAKELAERYGVSIHSMRAALKGHTFRHLNFAYPPQW
jgi:hypothetical protein